MQEIKITISTQKSKKFNHSKCRNFNQNAKFCAGFENAKKVSKVANLCIRSTSKFEKVRQKC